MVHVRSVRIDQADGRVWSLSDRPSLAAAEWISEDVAGWYGGAGVRGEVTARLGHGDFVARARREGRVMTLHGAVVCSDSDERDRQERALSGMVWDGDWATMTCDDGDRVLSARVRLDGAPQVVKVGVQALRFQLPLRSDTPFLYGSPGSVTLRPVGAGIGLEYPLFTRGGVLTFGSAVADVELLRNHGNATAWPVFTVVGDFPGGFSVGLADKRVTYPWPTFQDIPVTVDMAGGLAVSGVDQSHLLSERGWAGIQPGGVETPVFAPLQGGTGFCTVTVHDTYI